MQENKLYRHQKARWLIFSKNIFFLIYLPLSSLIYYLQWGKPMLNLYLSVSESSLEKIWTNTQIAKGKWFSFMWHSRKGIGRGFRNLASALYLWISQDTPLNPSPNPNFLFYNLSSICTHNWVKNQISWYVQKHFSKYTKYDSDC